MKNLGILQDIVTIRTNDEDSAIRQEFSSYHRIPTTGDQGRPVGAMTPNRANKEAP